MANLRNDPSQQQGQQKNPAFNKKGFQNKEGSQNLPDMDADATERQMGSDTQEDYSGGSEGDSVRESSNEGTGSDRREDWDRPLNVGDDKRSQQNLNVRGNSDVERDDSTEISGSQSSDKSGMSSSSRSSSSSSNKDRRH